MIRLWSAGAGDTAIGSYIDFTSTFGFTFWKSEVTKLLQKGAAGYNYDLTVVYGTIITRYVL